MISPDAALWLIPWEALPLDDTRYAVEGHAIHYVVSGRDLVTRGTKAERGKALVMADPDFDLGSLGGVPVNSAEVPRGRVSRDLSHGGWEFERLQGTLDEGVQHPGRGEGSRKDRRGTH